MPWKQWGRRRGSRCRGGAGGASVVVNPHQFKVISESAKKTDRHDAVALALYLEKDLLPEEEWSRSNIVR
ncbi:MAG TPA: hypothetical protein VN669_18045 [Candidatus Acidoferrales bacterium]|nr:hypothetical protein [Candidatus Acidoferrales bacterium]